MLLAFPTARCDHNNSPRQEDSLTTSELKLYAARTNDENDTSESFALGVCISFTERAEHSMWSHADVWRSRKGTTTSEHEKCKMAIEGRTR